MDGDVTLVLCNCRSVVEGGEARAGQQQHTISSSRICVSSISERCASVSFFFSCGKYFIGYL